VATSRISAGYDFPDVDLVIHFMPGAYKMTNFMQESGRAGRSPDRLAWSYCLVQPGQLQLPSVQKEVPLEQLHFSQYLLDQLCRRRVISRVYDSKALELCNPTWNQYDLCADRLETTLAVSIGVRQKDRQISESLDFFKRAVRYWTNERCLICFIRWNGEL
jgi:superfamily II DNA helicase RecQ